MLLAAIRNPVLKQEAAPQPGAVGCAWVHDFCGEAEADWLTKDGAPDCRGIAAPEAPAKSTAEADFRSVF